MFAAPIMTQASKILMTLILRHKGDAEKVVCGFMSKSRAQSNSCYHTDWPYFEMIVK